MEHDLTIKLKINDEREHSTADWAITIQNLLADIFRDLTDTAEIKIEWIR